MALGRPKAADRPDGVAWTVVEDGKDETVLFIPVGTVGKRRRGERWRARNRFSEILTLSGSRSTPRSGVSCGATSTSRTRGFAPPSDSERRRAHLGPSRPSAVWPRWANGARGAGSDLAHSDDSQRWRDY